MPNYICLTIKEANEFSAADAALAEELGFEILVSNYSSSMLVGPAAHMNRFLVGPAGIVHKLHHHIGTVPGTSRELHQFLFNTHKRQRKAERARFEHRKSHHLSNKTMEALRAFLDFDCFYSFACDGSELVLDLEGTFSFANLREITKNLGTQSMMFRAPEPTQHGTSYALIISDIPEEILARLNEIIPADQRAGSFA